MKENKLLLPLEPDETPEMAWLWIGTWSMGGEGFGPHDERESLEVLRLALREGIRHFDTAGFYAHGRSEELLSKALKGIRGSCFISTKGGLKWQGKKVVHDASPEGLRRALTESLHRLKTDYLDLFQLHWPDPQVPVPESIDALKEMQTEGLIRYWGVGNLSEAQVREYLSEYKDIPHQVHFNPLHRTDSVLRAGRCFCINCIISPLEQGLLAEGKSSSGRTALSKRDLRRRNPYFMNPQAVERCKKLRELTSKAPYPLSVYVLLWIASKEDVHTLIPGPRKIWQLKEILFFRNIVKDKGLLAGYDEEALLRGRVVRELFPMGLWEQLETLNRGLR
ncbi:MAG: aldo/keto reductase [Nitrospirae bacterium]|nr:aldo/keto reductase [Nitrospirota bacterium]